MINKVQKLFEDLFEAKRELGLQRQQVEALKATIKESVHTANTWQKRLEEAEKRNIPVVKTAGSGRYVFGGEIGRGSYGVVYLAMDTLMAEHVAVKELIFPSMMEVPDVGESSAPARRWGAGP